VNYILKASNTIPRGEKTISYENAMPENYKQLLEHFVNKKICDIFAGS
jgi:hypothetical protein